MKVLGVDPALKNVGISSGFLNLENMSFSIDRVDLFKTEPSKSKTTRKNSDDLERCRVLYQGLSNAAAGAEIAFVEMPVGSQSARAMMSYGACMMLIATLRIPVIELTPREVKVAATGDANATKREMIDWAFNKMPDAEGWRVKGKRLIDENEHMADAIGAINAGLSNPEFQALVAMVRTMRGAA